MRYLKIDKNRALFFVTKYVKIAYKYYISGEGYSFHLKRAVG